MIRIAAVIVTFLLAACQVVPQKYDENSPFTKVPNNSRLTLNQALTIAPYGLKAYVQNGQISYGPNQYYPFCKFEVREVKEISQIVEPDQFEITKVRQASGLMAGLNRHALIAGRSFDSGDGKPSPILYATQLFLNSPRQPQVYKLSCGHLQDPGLEARHLSINQIREALGGVFTLQTTAE